MTVLLDSQLLIWTALGSRLAKGAEPWINDAATDIHFSVASLWELAIKQATGRGALPIDCVVLRRRLLDAGFLEAPIEAEHALATLDLPHIHSDPFDRLLVAQARVEGLTLLTADKTLARYPGDIRRV